MSSAAETTAPKVGSLRFKYASLRTAGFDPLAAALLSGLSELAQGDIYANGKVLRVMHMEIQL